MKFTRQNNFRFKPHKPITNLKRVEMTIEVPVAIPDNDKRQSFEDYLKRNSFPFKRKGKEVYYYTITIDEPINAFWIGCNIISIQYGLLEK